MFRRIRTAAICLAFATLPFLGAVAAASHTAVDASCPNGTNWDIITQTCK
jgi:hypothetical protein